MSLRNGGVGGLPLTETFLRLLKPRQNAGEGTACQGELLIALRQMTKAFGGMSKVAEKAQLNSTHIYRTLSTKGNPEIHSLSAILKTMGMRLAVQPIQPSRRQVTSAKA
ncbi:hypothetical protein [Xylella fastidiosa]|uniref:helix-turn-helix domain-containing transcriptional regulator n=1 Tax=Xylella fastidiosa TaxID=2371 RepID=UPI002F269BB2